MGVPVTAHRLSACSAQIDFANDFEGSRIVCATRVSKSKVANHILHTFIKHDS